jgi:flagellar motor switch protein FliM
MIRPEPSRGDVVAYDFRRPSRISPDRQRNLEASHEQLAQLLQRWVSGRLRAPFEVHLETIGQATYGAFVDSLADPGAVFLYDVANMPDQTIAVCLDPSIAFLLVEKLVGGSSVTAAPERALTTLEQMIIRIVTDRVTREVSSVWKDHMALDFTFARFESARELIEMTGRNEDVLVISLRVEFEEVQGYIHVAVPFPVLESLLSSSSSGRGQTPARPTPERVGEQNRVEGFVRRAGVVVAVRLPGTRMTLGDLSALKAGDFLTTESSTADAVEVLVSNKLRFRGRQGRLGPHMGVQITDLVPVD